MYSDLEDSCLLYRSSRLRNCDPDGIRAVPVHLMFSVGRITLVEDPVPVPGVAGRCHSRWASLEEQRRGKPSRGAQAVAETAQ